MWMLISKIEVVSPARGVISTENSNVTVIAPDSGIIDYINIRAGDDVTKGDLLLSLKNIDNSYEYESTIELIDIYGRHRYELQTELRLLNLVGQKGALLLSETIESPKIKELLRKLQSFNNQKELFTKAEKVFSNTVVNLEQQKKFMMKKLLIIKNSIGKTLSYFNTQLEIARLDKSFIENKVVLNQENEKLNLYENEYLDELYGLESEIKEKLYSYDETLTKSKHKLNLMKAKLGATNITSANNGNILGIKEGVSKGVYIEKNSEILTIKKREGGVYVSSKVDSSYRKNISLGNKVSISLQATGVKRLFIGTIDNISVDSFEYSERGKEGKRYYKVKIMFDDNSDILDKYIGISVTANILNKKIMLYEYLFAVFNKKLSFHAW